MEERKKYLQYYDLDVSIDEQATGDILDLLDNTILGTSGGIRYRLLDTAEKIKAIPEIYFLSLRKFNRLLGTIGFVRRQFSFRDETYIAYYLRYFSIKSPMSTAKRKKSRRYDTIIKKKKRNILKEQAEEFMVNAHKYLRTADGQKTVLYAYIEQENQRSMEMSTRMGYETVRILTNEYFSRVFPKRDPAVERLSGAEKSQMRGEISSFYGDFTFFTEESLFYKESYFVYHLDGKIVAGVQATPVEWEIKTMPGITGWIFQTLVPFLPFLRRLFNPGRFRFVSLDAIYYKHGYELLLIPLFESVLAIQGVRTAVTWHDSESPVLKTIRKLHRLGVFRKLTSPRPADIRMRFIGFSDEEKERFYQYPSYVIAFDTT